MLYIRPGSQVRQLLTLLSIVGEFPVRSLHLLGNERVLKALVHKLTTAQEYCLPHTDTKLTTRLLTVSSNKSIRLYKAALPILNWLHPNMLDDYMTRSFNHHFPGNKYHIDRNHRVAESVAMFMRAGIESRPYTLPKLQNECITKLIPNTPCFYLAKDLKHLGEGEVNKTMFTRMVGTAFMGGKAFVVYNTRSNAMKWRGKGEHKTLFGIMDIARLNAGINERPAAILFGESEDVALRTLMESDKSMRPEFRFDIIYHHIYYVPMSGPGIRQLRMLAVPSLAERLLDMIFEPEERTYNRGMFEYDALVDGVHILSHLDGDIARLVRFKEAIQNQGGKFEVLCYPHQAEFISNYLGGNVGIKTINMDIVEAELGIERRNLLEE